MHSCNQALMQPGTHATRHSCSANETTRHRTLHQKGDVFTKKRELSCLRGCECAPSGPARPYQVWQKWHGPSTPASADVRPHTQSSTPADSCGWHPPAPSTACPRARNTSRAPRNEWTASARTPAPGGRTRPLGAEPESDGHWFRTGRMARPMVSNSG